MIRTLAAGTMLVVAVLSAGCAAAMTQEPQTAAVGRVVEIDAWGAFVIAEFPEGRRLIAMNHRELALYHIGGEIRIDQAGRPLPPRAAGPSSPRATS
ncbi:MAG TPA: hypothetical protein VIE37_19730 [Methylomirabilota bacterium]|jgi:hypothetical protein